MNFKKFIYNLLMVVFAGVFLFAGYKCYSIYKEYSKGSDTYENIVSEVAKEPQTQEKTYPDPYTRTIDFDKLSQINKDVVGWIYIPGTAIDYPVLQGESNQTYIYTLITGDSNKSGSIFMDYKNNADLTDDNTIIYGHHMRNGKMFKSLVKYKDQSFYDKWQNAYYYTKDTMYEVQIFSAYITDAQDDYLITKMGRSKEDYLSKFKSKSLLKTNVEVTKDDNIMSLATCTYEYDDARFIVHGKIVQKKALN